MISPQYITICKQIIHIIIKQLYFLKKLVNFICYTIKKIFIEYIEVIFILLYNIQIIFNLQIFEDHLADDYVQYLFQNKTKHRSIKKYVKVYNWTNKKLDEFTNAILHKPLKWRPTVPDIKLFQSELNELIINLTKKFKPIEKELITKSNPFKKSRIESKMHSFYNMVHDKFTNYIKNITQHQIRNQNMSTKKLNKIKKIPCRYPHLLALEADKNYGNVLVNAQEWKSFNFTYLNENKQNFIKSNQNKTSIIKDGINTIKELLSSYKSLIRDYGKALRGIHGEKFNNLGIFASIPKVHKKDKNGHFIRKLRPIISLKNTIITISSCILREITRKINYGLKVFCNHKLEMDDIRDIAVAVEEFNESNNHHTFKIKACASSDVNSMYDVINKFKTCKAFHFATHHLLPINFVTDKMMDLFYKAANHMFDFAYFIFEGIIYFIDNSQIQGTNSGGDCCSMVLNVNEIRKRALFNKLLLFIIRYKDDIALIPRIPINNVQELNTKILSVLYPDFEFESEINRNSCEICDVEIYTQNNHFLQTRSIKDKKIRSYINKSSNVKQQINGITKTLQERYIIINSKKEDYIKQKQSLYQQLIAKNEWTGYDLRKTEHLKYSQRDDYLQKYQEKKRRKIQKYINMKAITLFDHKWWNDEVQKKDINQYITYQKTMIDEKKINQILRQCKNELPSEVTDEYDIKIYYKYQKPLKFYLKNHK